MSKSKETKKKQNYVHTKKRRSKSGRFLAGLLVILAVGSVVFSLLLSIYYYL